MGGLLTAQKDIVVGRGQSRRDYVLVEMSVHAVELDGEVLEVRRW